MGMWTHCPLTIATLVLLPQARSPPDCNSAVPLIWPYNQAKIVNSIFRILNEGFPSFLFLQLHPFTFLMPCSRVSNLEQSCPHLPWAVWWAVSMNTEKLPHRGWPALFPSVAPSPHVLDLVIAPSCLPRCLPVCLAPLQSTLLWSRGLQSQPGLS